MIDTYLQNKNNIEEMTFFMGGAVIFHSWGNKG